MGKQTIIRGTVVALSLSLLMVAGVRQALGQAQGSTGQISGVVRDSTGAAVAGAAVRITGTETGLESSTTTNESGIYRFVLVPSGTYLLTTEATGFAKREVANVQVKVGQVSDINVTLGVGAVSETITVTADAI